MNHAWSSSFAYNLHFYLIIPGNLPPSYTFYSSSWPKQEIYLLSHLVNYNLTLSIGICHLLLKWLNHVLRQLLNLNTQWKQFKVEELMRHSVIRETLAKTGFQIARYFQEPILWAQFLYLLMSRKLIKSFMMTTVPCD